MATSTSTPAVLPASRKGRRAEKTSYLVALELDWRKVLKRWNVGIIAFSWLKYFDLLFLSDFGLGGTGEKQNWYVWLKNLDEVLRVRWLLWIHLVICVPLTIRPRQDPRYCELRREFLIEKSRVQGTRIMASLPLLMNLSFMITWTGMRLKHEDDDSIIYIYGATLF